MLRVNQVIPSLTSRMDGKETKKTPLHHEGRARTKSEVSRLKAQLGKKSSQPSRDPPHGGIGRFLRRSMAPQVMGLTPIDRYIQWKDLRHSDLWQSKDRWLFLPAVTPSNCQKAQSS